MASEMTFLILKSDCLARRLVGRVIARIEDAGMVIDQIMTRRKDKTWCKLHYGHVPADAYQLLEETMCEHTLIGMLVYGESAVARLRSLVGATDPLKASPGTIRGDWGGGVPYNLIHAADSQEAALHEATLFADPLTNSEE